jgi:hypothetical protein
MVLFDEKVSGIYTVTETLILAISPRELEGFFSSSGEGPGEDRC